MRKQKGFSLIELLIVVAIILIIAAIAVPNLLRSRIAANEASAAATIRTMGTALVTYFSTYNIGFPSSLLDLSPNTSATSTSADLLDSVLGQGTPSKSGYVFTYAAEGAGNSQYVVDATPLATGSSGVSFFCSNEQNTVRKDPAGTAMAGSSAGCTTPFNPL